MRSLWHAVIAAASSTLAVLEGFPLCSGQVLKKHGYAFMPECRTAGKITGLPYRFTTTLKEQLSPAPSFMNVYGRDTRIHGRVCGSVCRRS